MVEKGIDWVERLQSKPLSHSEAWLSMYFELFPAISWGLITVCMQPSKLDRKIQKVYEKALPFLGVNCKIKRESRTLPEMYQGLALPNFPLVALSEKVAFLFGNWRFHGQAPSDALAMVFKNFLIEVGLYSSPLDWDYTNYGLLSTKDTWFCNLWNLTHSFKATLRFWLEDQLHGIWEHDRSLLSKFFQVGFPWRRPCGTKHCTPLL
jgi:hypothetical protein